MPPRFVLDTSVVFPGRIVPVVSSATMSELSRVLAYPKFGLMPATQRALIDDYLPWCETVDVPDDTEVPECRDPSDIPFLQLAVVGEADALVTGDADLLALAPVFSVPILTAREAWERFTNA